jgi:hypothetical protein
MNSRSFIPIALFSLALVAAPGCKKEDPAPSAKAEPTGSARGKNRMNLKNPMGSMAKIPPQAMKDYRVDVCYYGTLSLKQARNAYLASLGKDEPSDKKIPSFGTPQPPTAGGPQAADPASSASASPKAGKKEGKEAKEGKGKDAKEGKEAKEKDEKKKAAAAESAAPSANKPGAMAAGGARPERKPFEFNRAPHERNARACTAAASLKDPAMGDLDGVLKDYAPFAMELAKDIATASNYYNRKEYEKDSFEKGKTLHKKLVESFAKLDEMHDKLGAAVKAWREANKPDSSKWTEGQKLASAALETAMSAVSALANKPDPEAFKAAVTKLETEGEALKKFAEANATDPWGKIISIPVENFLKTAKEAQAKVTDKGLEPETQLVLVGNLVSIIEARQRAISKSNSASTRQTPGVAAPAASANPSPH